MQGTESAPQKCGTCGKMGHLPIKCRSENSQHTDSRPSTGGSRPQGWGRGQGRRPFARGKGHGCGASTHYVTEEDEEVSVEQRNYAFKVTDSQAYQLGESDNDGTVTLRVGGVT